MHRTETTKITFLGTSSAIPDEGSDTASLLINDRILVDTGWNVISNLQRAGVQPTQIDYVLFTHFHQDHYVSLPSLLFYFMMRGKGRPPLKIIGPAEDVQQVVNLALEFLQSDRFFAQLPKPVVIPLHPGDRYEDGQFTIATCPTLHPVQGICCRFTDHRTGKTFSFTGDTAPFAPLIEHVRGSSLLITEASLGAGKANPEANGSLHSGAQDAAELAQQAGVGKLMLVHGKLTESAKCVEAAAQIFCGPVIWPKEGQTVEVD